VSRGHEGDPRAECPIIPPGLAGRDRKRALAAPVRPVCHQLWASQPSQPRV